MPKLICFIQFINLHCFSTQNSLLIDFLQKSRLLISLIFDQFLQIEFFSKLRNLKFNFRIFFLLIPIRIKTACLELLRRWWRVSWLDFLSFILVEKVSIGSTHGCFMSFLYILYLVVRFQKIMLDGCGFSFRFWDAFYFNFSQFIFILSCCKLFFGLIKRGDF